MRCCHQAGSWHLAPLWRNSPQARKFAAGQFVPLSAAPARTVDDWLCFVLYSAISLLNINCILLCGLRFYCLPFSVFSFQFSVFSFQFWVFRFCIACPRASHPPFPHPPAHKKVAEKPADATTTSHDSDNRSFLCHLALSSRVVS